MFGRKLVGSTALVAATATVGTIASADVDSDWYRSLAKPNFQPPQKAFPIVWPALYGSIALASAGVLAVKARKRAVAKRREEWGARPDAVQSAHEADTTRGYRRALLVNLVLNAGWSWMFFRRKDLDLALATAGGLAVSSTDLVRRAGRVRPGLGWLLAPYAAWCTFAAVLTGSIRSLNR